MRCLFRSSVAMLLGVTVSGLALAQRGLLAADAPTIDYALKLHPHNADVDYETPEPKHFKQCKVLPIKGKGKDEKVIGWEVVGPAGQVLRRFLDSNGDGLVDQWSYFRAGLEVYRDLDTDGNNKINQSRWLNLGGTRWGVDTNGDQKIDLWKQISPEEVSRIAVRALVSQDASLLAPLLATKEDLGQLGIDGALETKILAAVADPAGKLRKAISGSKIIHAKTTWMRFDASPPGVILADVYKTNADILVYENVMAIVDYGNAQQPGLVKVGELIKVGDVWKMTEIPQPLEGNNVELAPGLVMFHQLNAAGGAQAPNVEAAIPQKVQDLVEKKLKPLMESPPAAGSNKAAFDKHYKQIENVLIEIVNEMKTDEDRTQWTRQLLDNIASWVQSGNYPSGVARLKQLETEIAKSAPKSPLVAIARYRGLLAQYTISMQEAENNEARQKVHEQWLKDLEDFLDTYPKADDAPDAALQLAVALEFGGKSDKAKKWYESVVNDYEEAPAAVRARGALKRIDLNGQPLALSGTSLTGSSKVDAKQFRGKTLLVCFWDTRSKLFTEDLPQIKALYDEYRAKGFEVLGVNLDATKEDVAPYLSQHQIKWPQIFEAGGLESDPAKAFGIISLPTMFLVDPEGKVISRSASVEEVKKYLTDSVAEKGDKKKS